MFFFEKYSKKNNFMLTFTASFSYIYKKKDYDEKYT